MTHLNQPSRASSLARVSPLMLALALASTAASATTLSFKEANNTAACDQLVLQEETNGMVHGRQVIDNCPNGDYIVTGRRTANQGYLLFLATAGGGANQIKQLMLNPGGGIEALQMDGRNTPSTATPWAGWTWQVGAAATPTAPTAPAVSVDVATSAQLAGNYRVTDTRRPESLFYADFSLTNDGSCNIKQYINQIFDGEAILCVWSYDTAAQTFKLTVPSSGAYQEGKIVGNTFNFTLNGRWANGEPNVVNFVRRP